MFDSAPSFWQSINRHLPLPALSLIRHFDCPNLAKIIVSAWFVEKGSLASRLR
jgi:hypothetical protein